MERAWAELKMGASGEPVFGFAASSTLPFIAHGGLVEQASVATIRKAAMQLKGPSQGVHFRSTNPRPETNLSKAVKQQLEKVAEKIWVD